MKKTIFLLLIGMIGITLRFFITHRNDAHHIPSYTPSPDDPYLMVTQAQTVTKQPITLKEVKLWNGEYSLVEDKFVRSGVIIDGESFYCSNIHTLDIAIQNDNGKNVCLILTGITKKIHNQFSKMTRNDILKTEYKNKSISVTGYGWDNNLPEHKQLPGVNPPDKLKLKKQNREIKCNENLRIFVYDLKM